MRKDGTLRFGDFVSAILHLSDAFGMFILATYNNILYKLFAEINEKIKKNCLYFY